MRNKSPEAKHRRLIYLLSVAQRRLQRWMAAQPAREVTPAQAGLLFILGKQDGALMGEVGAALDLGPAGISGLVDRSATAGLIERRADREDGRAWRVWLTPKGRNVLAQAIAYSQIFFGGAILPWLMNTMAGILRGTGNMKLPSTMILSSAVWQIMLGGTLGLGLGPVPQFGMRGVAAGSLIAYSISISVMGWYLFSGRARVKPKLKGLRVQWVMFIDILKVGAVSCFSPLQSVLTISIFTHMLAQFGTAVLAGYGIGARLEFMLTSVAFAVGIASVPMIGMAVGAERIARARRIAWTAGTVSFLSVGVVGSFIAVFPDLWVNLFTSDPHVRATSHQYLSTAAPMYAFIGLAMSMYFSSQGAAKVLGPVLAQTARLIFIGTGGWWLSTHEASAQNFFALAAASMGVLGVLSCLSVILTRWGKSAQVAEAQPALS